MVTFTVWTNYAKNCITLALVDFKTITPAVFQYSQLTTANKNL